MLRLAPPPPPGQRPCRPRPGGVRCSRAGSQAADTGSISGTVTARPRRRIGVAVRRGGGRPRPPGPDRHGHHLGAVRGRRDASGPTAAGRHLRDPHLSRRTTATLGQLGYEYYDDKWSPYGATEVVVSGGSGHAAARHRAAADRQRQRPRRQRGGPADGGRLRELQPGRRAVATAPGHRRQRAATTASRGSGRTTSSRASYLVSARPSGYGDRRPAVLPTTTYPVTVGRWRSPPPRTSSCSEQPMAVFTVLDTDGQPLANAPLVLKVRDADLNDAQWGPLQSGPHETDPTAGTGSHRPRRVQVFIRAPVGYTGHGRGEHWDNAYAMKTPRSSPSWAASRCAGTTPSSSGPRRRSRPARRPSPAPPRSARPSR